MLKQNLRQVMALECPVCLTLMLDDQGGVWEQLVGIASGIDCICPHCHRETHNFHGRAKGAYLRRARKYLARNSTDIDSISNECEAFNQISSDSEFD